MYGIDKICEPFMYMEVACNVSNSEVEGVKKILLLIKGHQNRKEIFLIHRNNFNSFTKGSQDAVLYPVTYKLCGN